MITEPLKLSAKDLAEELSKQENKADLILFLKKSEFYSSITQRKRKTILRSLQIPRTFHNEDFKGANLKFANLVNTRFIECKLDGADLTSANLEGAELRNSSCITTKFIKTKLERTDLRWVILINADFRGAKFKETTISHADFHNVRNFTQKQLNKCLGTHFVNNLPEELEIPPFGRVEVPRKLLPWWQRLIPFFR